MKEISIILFLSVSFLTKGQSIVSPSEFTGYWSWNWSSEDTLTTLLKQDTAKYVKEGELITLVTEFLPKGKCLMIKTWTNCRILDFTERAKTQKHKKTKGQWFLKNKNNKGFLIMTYGSNFEEYQIISHENPKTIILTRIWEPIKYRDKLRTH